MDGYYYGSSSLGDALTDQYSLPPSNDLTNLLYAPIPAFVSNDDRRLLEELEGDAPVRSYRLYFLCDSLIGFSHYEDHDWTPRILAHILEGNNDDLDVWLWVDGDETWVEEQVSRQEFFLPDWECFDGWMTDQFRQDATVALRRRWRLTSSSSPHDSKHQKAVTSDNMHVDGQDLAHPDILFGALVAHLSHIDDESISYISQRLADIFTIEMWDTCNKYLMKHLTPEPPNLGYLPWINSYPDWCRDDLHESLSYGYYGKLRESVTCYLSTSTSSSSTGTNSRTLFGAVVWVVSETRDWVGDVYRLNYWFKMVSESVNCFPGLPEIKMTLTMALLYQQITESRVICSKSHDVPIFDLYVSVMAFLNELEVLESLEECVDYWGWKCVLCHTESLGSSSNTKDSSLTSSREPSLESDPQASNVPPFTQPTAPNPPSPVAPSQSVINPTFYATGIRHESSAFGGLSLLVWASNSVTYLSAPLGGRENVTLQASVNAVDEVYSILPTQDDQNHPMDFSEDLSFPWTDLGLAIDGTSAATHLPVSNNLIIPGLGDAVGRISAVLRDPRLSFADRQALLNEVQQELIDVASLNNLFISVPTVGHLTLGNVRLSEIVPTGFSFEPMNEDVPLAEKNQAIQHDVPPVEISEEGMTLVMNDVAAAPSPRTGEKMKAKKVNTIKLYLRMKLEEIRANPPGGGVPRSTLPQLVKKCRYEFVNWPKDVPVPIPSENKGIMGLRAKQINSLYRAVTRQDEARQLMFQPIGSGALEEQSMEERAERIGSGALEEQSMEERAERIGAGGEMLRMQVLTQEDFLTSASINSDQ
ncbi:hypothetical protein JAAARDRAFT_200734 [Jaapia argillacea MUCL 33604]|uniref:Uncharacterized protein n=1 Tax=Jaapia argillacea MUCL 33604 TaxID=933084 RepID=A0A067P3T7_9AGAM|nr:hypothetical protein JAAARDRAFT_200734 [Jaapia argillacea MUCL 33604]